MSHTDAGTLLKLADRIKRSTVFFRSGDPPRPSVDLTDAEKQLLIDALLRQAASQGSAGGEAVAWQIKWPDGEVSFTRRAPDESVEKFDLLVTPLYALSRPVPTGGTEAPVCCYCDAALSCSVCGREQPATVAQASGDCGIIEFEYCNWEGRKAIRQARPISIRFGKSEWHPKPQWLLLAFDIDKEAEREFAMADMAFEDDALVALSLSSASRGTEA